MSLFPKTPNQNTDVQPSDSDLREAATERLGELSQYCAWQSSRTAARYDWADEIIRDLRKVQDIAPRYAAQASASPQADEYLRSIMTDSAIAIAKLKLRKQNDDRIDTAISNPPAVRRSAANSDDTAVTAALFGAQAASVH